MENIKKKNYSWIICISTTILLFSSIGIMMNAFSAYAPYMITERGFSNTQMSLINTAKSLAAVLSLSLIDVYYRKLDIKRGFAIAMLTGVLAMVAFAFAHNFALMLIGAILSGLCKTLGGTIPASILINRWFIKRKGLALSICLSGTGLATTVMPPVIVACINRFGVDTTFLLNALLILILSVMSITFIANTPEDKGLSPYGDDYSEEQKTKAAEISISKKYTVLLLCAMTLIGIASSETTQLFTLHFTTIGFSVADAAAALSVWGATLTAGKFLYGIVIDKFGAYKANYVYVFGSALGIALCCLACNQSYFIMMASMVVIGLTFPFNTIGISIWAADLYNEKEYMSALKKMNLAMQIGFMAFSMLPGIVADLVGNYVFMYGVFAVMMFAAGILVQLVYIRHRKTSRS